MDRTLASEHLFLYNTLARRKELFTPRNQGQVKMFTCGPSIYRRQHLGNYRTFLYEDLLQRYLEYRGYAVERMINFTDVEDKTIAEVREHSISLSEVTRPVEDHFLQEAEQLRIKLPSSIPRSSTHVESAVRLIQALMDKGHAYRHGQDIYFDPLTYPGFGKVFGLDMSGWPLEKKRFSKDTYPGQRWNLGDFILWHGYRAEDGDVFWETPLGKGRPSWNIQDQSMIAEHLGFELDIHCGGVDNLYRHHDYNLAVMESVSGKEFSRYWLHGDYLLINGMKMSKSLENITYPSDLFQEGHDPLVVRFFLINGHYREQLDLTDSGLAGAEHDRNHLRDMAGMATTPDGDVTGSGKQADVILKELVGSFEDAMNNDLSVHLAIQGLQTHLPRLLMLKIQMGLNNRTCARIKNTLERIDSVLQVLW